MLSLEMAARGAPLEGSNVPESMRGSQAAVLPYYFDGQEKAMAGDATELYKAIQARNGSPGVQIANYDALLGKYDSSNAQNDQLAADLASGRLTDQSIAESAPVFQNRLDTAAAKRNAGLEALRETLNEIDSIQAGKGYSGDSTGNRMLRFNARRAIGTQSAADFGDARAQNAMEKRGLQAEGRSQRLGNINLPDSLARAALNRDQLATNAVTASQQNAMSPFSFFNIGTHEFKSPNQLSAVDPSSVAIANTIGQTGATIGGALTRYYGNKNLAEQARSQAYTTRFGSAPPTNYGAMTAAQAGQYNTAMQAGRDWSAANPGSWE